MNIRTLLLTGMALGAFAMIGCASSTITPIGDTKISMTPFKSSTSTINDDALTLKLSEEELVVSHITGRTELRIEKFNRTPAVVWSTSIIYPTSNTRSASSFLGIPLGSIPGETPIALFRKGAELVQISYRDNEIDTIFAIVRSFDVATGSQTRFKRLDTFPIRQRLERKYRGYQVSISPDTSRILLSFYDPDLEKGSFQFRLVSIPIDFSSTVARTLKVSDYHDDGRLAGLHIDSHGKIYFVFGHESNTASVMTYDINTGFLGTPITTRLVDGMKEDVEIGSITSAFDDDQDLILTFSIKLHQSLYGVTVAKFDTDESRFAYIENLALTDTILQRLLKYDRYMNPTPHSVVYTKHANARYILVFEQVNAIGWDPRISKFPDTRQKVGALLLLAFDANGKPTWQQAINKASGWTEYPTSAIMKVTKHGTLRVVYRADAELIVREYGLESGTEVASATKALLEMGGAAYYRSRGTTWLDDDTIVLLTMHGMINRDWNLTCVQMK